MLRHVVHEVLHRRIGFDVPVDIVAVLLGAARIGLDPVLETNHALRRLNDAAVEARAVGAENGVAEQWRIRLFGQVDGKTEHIALDLHPEPAVRGAPACIDLLRRETGRPEVPHDVLGAVGDGLHDGAVDVGGRVLQAESPDHAPDLRVHEGIPVPLPVVEDDEPFGADPDLLRLRVEVVSY